MARASNIVDIEIDRHDSSSDRQRVTARRSAATEIDFAVADVPEPIAVQNSHGIQHRPTCEHRTIRKAVVVRIDIQINRRRRRAPNEKEC